MNNPFQQLKKNFYTRVQSPYLPCTPGKNTRTALVNGQEAPIEVYNGKLKGRPELLNQYLIHGYRFSERRKREIHERLFSPTQKLNPFDGKLFLEQIFSKQVKISAL